MITKVKSGGQFVFELLYASSREYSIDRVSRMSAAVAYRALFALTPLFIISVGALGVFLGSDQEAQAQIYAAIDRVAGAEIADAFETFMGTAFVGSGSATVVGLVLLLWTTSSLFN
ncbi:MAG: YhjD/YihY/BrkB family envelope integrity protein, partial [Acidimicrobiia bacterium]